MDELGLQALHRRVAGIDVHRMLHLVTVLIEQKARPDPSLARLGVRAGRRASRRHYATERPNVNDAVPDFKRYRGRSNVFARRVPNVKFAALGRTRSGDKVLPIVKIRESTSQ